MRRLAAVLAATLAATACGDREPADSAVGTLERDRVELIAESQEPIVEIAVTEGDHVEAGDVLLRLDATRAEARLAQAHAARDRAQRRLDELVRGPRRENILEAEARLEGAETDAQFQEAEVRRVRALVEERLVSPQDLDRTLAARDQALAARDAAAAELAALLHGTTVEELDQARQTLAEAEAVVTELEVDVERLTVRAPASGTIDALPYEPGEQPPRGATVAVMLEDGQAYARVYIPAAIRSRVGPDTRAAVRVDGISRIYQGRVRFVASDAAFTPYFALNERDRGRLSYLAEVAVMGDDAGELPTGVPVTVTFPDTSHEGDRAGMSPPPAASPAESGQNDG
ncbi:MAG: HlyD family efflux transporter periplasmic adaptor subunit [Gammaproteobacteria bacterium]|nr:HlyD family efflux transporter periplasmic adaptor subunit [Gammaproteobacteria bacterium]